MLSHKRVFVYSDLSAWSCSSCQSASADIWWRLAKLKIRTQRVIGIIRAVRTGPDFVYNARSHLCPLPRRSWDWMYSRSSWPSAFYKALTQTHPKSFCLLWPWMVQRGMSSIQSLCYCMHNHLSKTIIRYTRNSIVEMVIKRMCLCWLRRRLHLKEVEVGKLSFCATEFDICSSRTKSAEMCVSLPISVSRSRWNYLIRPRLHLTFFNSPHSPQISSLSKY